MKKTFSISKRIISFVMAVLMTVTVWSVAVPASAVCENDAHVPYDSIPAKAPTCTEDGWTSERSCQVCHTVIKPSTAVPKKGHRYDEWTIDVPPTSKTKGHAFTNCLACNEPMEYEILPIGGEKECVDHVYTTGNSDSDFVVLIPATCTVTGVKAHYCTNCGTTMGVGRYYEIPLASHSFGPLYIQQYASCEEPEIKFHVCEVCQFREEIVGGSLGHVWYEWEETVYGDCTGEAYQMRSCDRCHQPQKKMLGRKGPHKLVVIPYIAPTCQSEGAGAGTYCEICGYVIQEVTVIPKLPHVDQDKDLVCDLCKTKLDCTCICHNTKGLAGVFAKVVIFIWRLLGVSRNCKCGVEHYTIYKPNITEPTSATVPTSAKN